MLILCDVDGTVVDNNQLVPDSARTALAQANANGHILMLCTGRSLPEVYDFLWDLGFSGIVAANGTNSAGMRLSTTTCSPIFT